MKKVSLLSIGIGAIALAVCGADAAERPANVAFLGIAATPTATEVADHFDLPEGVGLTVQEVVAGGPADGRLLLNDVIFRLDDQWLVDFRQLAAVVRMKKPGDTVTVEYLRKGQRSKTEIKLGQRDWTPLPASERPDEGIFQRRFRPFPRYRPDRMDLDDSIDPSDVADGLPPAPPFPVPPMMGRPDPDAPERRTEVRIQSRSVVTETRDGKQSTLVTSDGHREFEVKDADGQVLFKGPVNTPEEMDAVPQEHRATLHRLLRGKTIIAPLPPRGIRGPAL